MHWKRIIIIEKILLALVMLTGCIETFHPDVDLDINYIVVTGSVTNENPVRVNIDGSIEAKTKASIEVNGATVTLFGDDGTEEILSDKGNGLYEGNTVGIPNVSYAIEIILPNTKVIRSEWQLLKPGTEVGELSIEQSVRSEIKDGYENKINGLDLNLYLNESDVISRYYRWKLEGTYEFHSPLSADICYVPDFFSGKFILGESISNDRDIISKKLAFLESNGKKFSLGYSMEVSQFTLNNDAYNYWKKIDGQQNNVGSVFDAPPAQIIGNLKYINGEEIPVLGFFEASFITKKRLFIRPSDFVKEPILETSPCGFDNPPGWCFDCTTLVGSKRDKPSYWPN